MKHSNQAIINICAWILIGVTNVLFQNCTIQSGNIEETEESSNWTRLGPGGGGSTFIPTFSYFGEDRFMIRCDMTGAYLTNDGGESFKQINYPNGSNSFAYDPSDSATIYVGSSSLNRSSNSGLKWERIFPPKEDIIEEYYKGDHANFIIRTSEKSLYSNTGQYKAVRNIRVDPNNSSKIYFSINEFLFSTSDGGISWVKTNLNQRIEYIYTNTRDLKDKIYVTTKNGINVFDKDTWKHFFVEIPEEMQPAFSFTGGTTREEKATVFYALHNDETMRVHGGISPTTVWVSRNLGETWEQIRNDLILNIKNEYPTYSHLVASENDAANVYLVTSSYKEQNEDKTTAHWYGAIKSTDAGNSWKWVWKGGGGSGQYAIRDGIDASNLDDAWVQKAFGGEYIRLLDVGVAPNNGDVAIVTDWYRTMKTMDGGNTWTAIYSNEQSDGSYESNGLDVTTNYGVHFDPFDKDHICISYTDIGLHQSFNGGKSWLRSAKGIPPEWHNTCYWMVFDPDIKGKMWSVWSGLHDFPRGKMTRNPKWKERGMGGVAVSVDGGKTWKPTTKGMGFDSPATSIVLDENSMAGNRTLYVAAYGKGVFKSLDDGQSWELRNNGINGSLAAFELTILPNGTLYLVTSATPQHKNGKKGRDVFLGAVYKSVDGASTWQKLDLGSKVGFPNGLTFDPQNPDRLYLGSWADISLSDLIGQDVAKASGGNEWIDLEGGILLSEDGGETWTQVFDEDHYVYDVTIDPAHPGRVYCNTFDQGAYRSDDFGKTWNKLKDYNFHWGHRVIIDKNNSEMVYLTTYGSSVFHGKQ